MEEYLENSIESEEEIITESEVEAEDEKTEENNLVEKVNETLLDTKPLYVSDALTGVNSKIVEKAIDKINDDEIVEKHAKRLAEISDKALEVETETQELIVEDKKATNKVTRQEIKNRLIEKQTEAKRLRREQKQVLKEQKEEYRKRNKEIQWDMYKEKLEKMHYSYVPNPFILAMLLFFDGVVSFFNGLGAVSTAIMKAVKWIIIVGLIILAVYVIPVTHNILSGILW